MLENQDFHPASGFLFTEKPGRNHLDIVHHQKVTLSQERREIEESMISKTTSGPLNTQEP